MKVLENISAMRRMVSASRIFNPQEHLAGKRIAVVGPADSAFEKPMGDYINGFDYVIRINKAPHSLSESKMPFIGNRTDVLFHSFFENNETGGGPIDFDLYKEQGVKFLINPNNCVFGLRAHLAYFKRNSYEDPTFLLPWNFYHQLRKNFGEYVPTVGYSALYTALHSGAKEVYITGFTFFKTPYMSDYRDHLKDVDTNQKHIKDHGMHNPDLELSEFIKNYMPHQSFVKLDDALKDIVKTHYGSRSAIAAE